MVFQWIMKYVLTCGLFHTCYFIAELFKEYGLQTVIRA